MEFFFLFLVEIRIWKFSSTSLIDVTLCVMTDWYCVPWLIDVTFVAVCAMTHWYDIVRHDSWLLHFASWLIDMVAVCAMTHSYDTVRQNQWYTAQWCVKKKLFNVFFENVFCYYNDCSDYEFWECVPVAHLHTSTSCPTLIRTPVTHIEHTHTSTPSVTHMKYTHTSTPSVTHMKHTLTSTPSVTHTKHTHTSTPSVTHMKHTLIRAHVSYVWLFHTCDNFVCATVSHEWLIHMRGCVPVAPHSQESTPTQLHTHITGRHLYAPYSWVMAHNTNESSMSHDAQYHTNDTHTRAHPWDSTPIQWAFIPVAPHSNSDCSEMHFEKGCQSPHIHTSTPMGLHPYEHTHGTPRPYNAASYQLTHTQTLKPHTYLYIYIFIPVANTHTMKPHTYLYICIYTSCPTPIRWSHIHIHTYSYMIIWMYTSGPTLIRWSHIHIHSYSFTFIPVAPHPYEKATYIFMKIHIHLYQLPHTHTMKPAALHMWSPTRTIASTSIHVYIYICMCV